MSPRLRQDAHPWTLKILEVLSDGEWHDYNELLRLAAPLVPPALAWRQAESNRLTHYKRTGREAKERQKGGRADTLKTGQRHFVRIALGGLARSHGDRTPRVDIEYTEGKQRKRPLRVRLHVEDPIEEQLMDSFNETG